MLVKGTELLCPLCPLPWDLNLLSAKELGPKCCEILKCSKKKKNCQTHEIRGGRQREWERGILTNTLAGEN